MARGDEAALGAFYDLYGRVAYGLALRIVRDARLAEDVVQDSFLSVWRCAGSFRSGLGTERGWLLAIVHRRAVDAVRRLGRQLPVSPSPEPSVDDEGGDALERERVRRALATLPARKREVLVLAYYEGLTQSEIAAAVSVPLGTVKSRIHRGRLALRDRLAGRMELFRG